MSKIQPEITVKSTGSTERLERNLRKKQRMETELVAVADIELTKEQTKRERRQAARAAKKGKLGRVYQAA